MSSISPPPLFTARISMASYFARLGLTRFVAAAVALGLMWIYADHTVAAMVSGSVVIILIIVFVQIWRLRVEVTKENICHYGGLARRRTVSLATLAPVITFSQYAEQGFGFYPRVLLRDDVTGAAISLNGLYWGDDTISRIVQLLEEAGKEVERYDEPVDSVTVTKKFPKYVTYLERHPYQIAFAIVFLLLIAIAVFTFVFM